MKPELRKTLKKLVEEVHKNAAAGLMSREIIILADEIEREISREPDPFPSAETGRIPRETR